MFMKLSRAHFATAVGATLLLGVAGCSSSSPSSAEPGPDAGASGDAAETQGDGSEPLNAGSDSGGRADAASCDGGALGAPVTHRAADVGCSPTSLTAAVFPDGGPPCTADSECVDAGGGVSLTCLQGKCSADQCLVDSDCPTGAACGCANSYYGGNAIHANSCFTSQCRVDSDCGPGGYCSPSFGAYCGALTGYFCHTAADTCTNDTDCSCASSSGSQCAFAPASGHWQCGPAVACAG
jgi:hypothetical protein